MRLLSLSDFKRLAEIQDSSGDVLLAAMLELVSGDLEKEMDRVLTYGHYTELQEPGAGPILSVHATPIDVSGVDSEMVDHSLILSDNGATLQSTSYGIDANRGRITMINYQLQDLGYPTTSINYWGGYRETGVKEEKALIAPNDLRMACYLQTAHFWRNRKELGLNSFSAGGLSVAMAPAELLPRVKKICQNNRRYY